MPLVRITLRKGNSSEFLASVGQAIQDALVAQAKIPPDDRFQLFDEVEGDRIIADCCFAGLTPGQPVKRSAGLLVIEITLNEGRSDEVKAALYADIARRLGAIGVRPDDVFINLVEVKKQNWSMASGLMTYPS
jgi:phenylpyruvate tautomerase PptA (4-oxalocrotonate tautomerase family)